MIYVRRRVCSSQQQKNGPSTSMISYKTDNSEEQDGFLSISRRGYNGRNNIQYVSERIPNNALHHITPFPLHRSSKHRPCNEHIYQAYMDIPSRGWEERSWIVIGGPWCWTIALFFPTEKKVRLEIKQRGQQADNCDVAREEYANIRLFCIDFLSHFPKYVRLSGQRKETNHLALSKVTQNPAEQADPPHTFP